jgi:hypothetical protein
MRTDASAAVIFVERSALDLGGHLRLVGVVDEMPACRRAKRLADRAAAWPLVSTTFSGGFSWPSLAASSTPPKLSGITRSVTSKAILEPCHFPTSSTIDAFHLHGFHAEAVRWFAQNSGAFASKWCGRIHT